MIIILWKRFVLKTLTWSPLTIFMSHFPHPEGTHPSAALPELCLLGQL